MVKKIENKKEYLKNYRLKNKDKLNAYRRSYNQSKKNKINMQSESTKWQNNSDDTSTITNSENKELKEEEINTLNETIKKLKIEVNKLKKINEEQNEIIKELEKQNNEQNEIIENDEEEIKNLEKQNNEQYEIIENDEEEIERLNSKITKLTREINELRNNNVVKPKHSYPRSQMAKNEDGTPKLCYY